VYDLSYNIEIKCLRNTAIWIKPATGEGAVIGSTRQELHTKASHQAFEMHKKEEALVFLSRSDAAQK
jgi:hypothetical protein